MNVYRILNAIETNDTHLCICATIAIHMYGTSTFSKRNMSLCTTSIMYIYVPICSKRAVHKVEFSGFFDFPFQSVGEVIIAFQWNFPSCFPSSLSATELENCMWCRCDSRKEVTAFWFTFHLVGFRMSDECKDIAIFTCMSLYRNAAVQYFKTN